MGRNCSEAIKALRSLSVRADGFGAVCFLLRLAVLLVELLLIVFGLLAELLLEDVPAEVVFALVTGFFSVEVVLAGFFAGSVVLAAADSAITTSTKNTLIPNLSLRKLLNIASLLNGSHISTLSCKYYACIAGWLGGITAGTRGHCLNN